MPKIDDDIVEINLMIQGSLEKGNYKTYGTESSCVTSRLSATAVEEDAHCLPYSLGNLVSSCMANSLPTPIPIRAETGIENTMFRGWA